MPRRLQTLLAFAGGPLGIRPFDTKVDLGAFRMCPSVWLSEIHVRKLQWPETRQATTKWMEIPTACVTLASKSKAGRKLYVSAPNA